VAAAIAVGALTISVCHTSYADDVLADGTREIQIDEPGTTYLGQTYNRLAGAWWNWGLKEPQETNPIVDDTGADCRRNQQGDIWFLAGTFFGEPVTRTCRIPAGKALFFPIANAVSVYPDFPEPSNRCTLSGRFNLNTVQGQLGGVRCDANDDLILDAISGTEIVNKLVPIKVTIDDLSTPKQPDLNVPDLFAYRSQTQPGGYIQKIPPGSVFTQILGLTPGNRFPSVADGYWILLKPLPTGQYRVYFKSENIADGSVVDVTYMLTVGRP
jgi:hypothetical protein